MNLTAKSRYALKLMMDLADEGDELPRQRRLIAERQGIPVDFMDHILARLRDHGLVDCIRGRRGGIKLKKSAEAISLWDILVAAEDSVYPVQCLDGTCDHAAGCLTRGVWADIFLDLKKHFASRTLKSIVLQFGSKWEVTPISPDCGPHVDCANKECRAPRKV